MWCSNEKDDGPIVSADHRKGYRVAITARITYPNSEQRLDPFIKKSHYQKLLGPMMVFSTLRLDLRSTSIYD
jgi:hypothetical protein